MARRLCDSSQAMSRKTTMPPKPMRRSILSLRSCSFARTSARLETTGLRQASNELCQELAPGDAHRQARGLSLNADVQEAVAAVRKTSPVQLTVGVMLGAGLGALA